jgi:Ubiquitin fold domain/ThiF family
LSQADRLQVKRIAGKIIPAIATTTSVVSGLVALELAKIAIGLTNIASYRNAFLNLAIPVFALSEPAEAPRVPITKKTFYTLWDKWEVKEGALTVQEFMDWFTKKWGLKVNGVFQGTTIVYAPFFPAHAKRLNQK